MRIGFAEPPKECGARSDRADISKVSGRSVGLGGELRKITPPVRNASTGYDAGKLAKSWGSRVCILTYPGALVPLGTRRPSQETQTFIGGLY